MKLLLNELLLIAVIGTGYSCNGMETERVLQSRAGTPVPRYIPQAEDRYPHEQLIQASWASNLDEICRLLISFSGKLVHGENLVAVIYLHKVAEEARKDFVKMIKAKGMKAECFATKEGWTALHLAASNDNGPLVRELVRRGAPVNAGTNTGLTPLHRAAAYGWKAVVEILLES